MSRILQVLFGCTHRNTTRVWTRKQGLPVQYVNCLDCGKEIPYTRIQFKKAS
jgi:RNA polymerase-binding transcription factor DksA